PLDHDSARLGPDPTPGIGLSSPSCNAYSSRYGVMVLSPSAGSSQRGTGVKCMPMVSVPSGAAATPAAPPTQNTTHRIGPRTRRRVRENGVIGRDCIIGALSTPTPRDITCTPRKAAPHEALAPVA